MGNADFDLTNSIFTNTFASGMFPVAAFYAFTALAGHPLRIDIAFPALQLFTMLEGSLREVPRLITVLLNANVAITRMTALMNEPNKETTALEFNENANINCPSAATSGNANASTKSLLILENASFAWPEASEPILRDINLAFPRGLTVVCGKVGGGKTALLQALLGELDLRGGRAIHQETAIAYCAQTPWLQSMSIRENIIFFRPFNSVRYKQVLEACALVSDFASFKSGDLSEIGENGVGLSGGM